MKIKSQDAPHIRHQERTISLMTDVIITLLLLYVMAFYYYGVRVILLGALSVATCLAADVLCLLMRRSRPRLRDLSAVVTGLLLPLLMPASVPYLVVATAALFGIVVAKHPFGGVGHNVFNPAAAGICFAVICFGADVFFAYPPTQEKLPAFGAIESTIVNSPAFTLQLGGVPQLDLSDMALGNFVGPMGATNILVILACLLFLVFRKTIRWEMPVAFFVTAALFAFLFPRADMPRTLSVCYELMSGMLFFGGVFLLGDPVTSPKRGWSKVAYGVVAGIVVMLFRRYGNLEEEFVFAILIMNATVWGFDMLGERLARLVRGKQFESVHGTKIHKKA